MPCGRSATVSGLCSCYFAGLSELMGRIVKKRLLCTTAIAALIAAPALAAPPVPFTWTGFYVGGNIGYSWGNGFASYSEPAFSCCSMPTSFSGSQSLNGVIGGPEIGYNWQVNPITVVGLETDFQWSGEKGSNSFAAPYCFDCEGPSNGVINGTLNTNILWFGTVRARAGIVTPNIFAYLTGGLAYGKISTSGSVSDTYQGSPYAMWSFGGSAIKVGGTVGAGIEGIVPFANEWTWKVEYLFIDFGTVSGNGYDTDFGGPFSWSTSVTDNIVRFGLNRKFP